MSIICTRVNIHACIFWPCELDLRHVRGLEWLYVLHGFVSKEVGEFFCIMYLDDNLVAYRTFIVTLQWSV